MKWVPRHEFERQANAHHVGRCFRKTSHWDHFGALVVGQLGGKQSLRDIETNLKVQKPLLYHAGMTQVSKSTLARLNEQQPAALYESLFYRLAAQSKRCAPRHGFRFKNPLYSMDSTLIDLSIKLFPWSSINGSGKGAMKLHVGLNHAGHMPEFACMTDGKRPDLKAAQQLNFPAGSIVAKDRGYTSFDLYKSLSEKGIFFVTRLRCDLKYRVIARADVSRYDEIRSDQRIRLTGEKGKHFGNLALRRVSCTDAQTGERYVFLTNHTGLSPRTVAAVYKARWQVELFFKHIKQNLKIKSFLGNSVNAIMTQVWVAMCVQLLLMCIKWHGRIDWSVQRMVRVLSLNLFMKYGLEDLFHDKPPGPEHAGVQGVLKI
jgi:putative transposase